MSGASSQRMLRMSLLLILSESFFLLIKFSANIVLSVHATRTWSELAGKWFARELGADSSEVLHMKRIGENPQSHIAWNSRAPENIANTPEISV